MTSGNPEVAAERLTFSRWVGETALRWRIVARTILVSLVAAALAAIFMPTVYRASAIFVANTSSGNKLAASLASSGLPEGLASQFGVSSVTDPSESGNFYIQLIGSRELRTRLLLSRFRNPRSSSPRDSARLLDILRIRSSDPARRMEIAVKALSKQVGGYSDTKTNLVWINTQAQWPDLSAAMANRTVELVTAFNREQRVSRTRGKRVFLEGRVVLARTALLTAEARLRNFYDQNRTWRSSPSLVSEEQSLQRDAERTANLYLQLQQLLETTLLEEVDNAPLITPVDTAVPPRKAEWPRYGVLLMSSVTTGFLLGLLIAGCMAVVADWRRHHQEESAELSNAFRRVKSEVFGVFRANRRR